jgi:hypothetical protein
MFVPQWKHRPPRLVKGTSLLFYMWMFIPHWKHRLPWLVKDISLLFYMWMFVPHWKHRPPRLVKGIALLFYMCIMFVPHWKHRSPRLVTGIACYHTDSCLSPCTCRCRERYLRHIKTLNSSIEMTRYVTKQPVSYPGM